MSNLIQIKRSATTATPPSLANGELAFSGNNSSNSLFVGHPDGTTGVVRIAGGKYGYLHAANTANGSSEFAEGGKLAANAVVITDANSSINEVRAAKLIINTSGNTDNEVTSISIFANSTQLGAAASGSNTELVTSDAIKTYVDGKTASLGAAVADTQVVYSASGTLSGDPGLTYNAGLNVLSVANSVAVGANVILSNTSLLIGNSTVNAVLTDTSFSIGNSTVNTSITSSAVDIDGTLDVADAVSFLSTANIAGAAEFGNTVLIIGNTTISNTIAVTGNATFSNTLAVTGETTLSGTLEVTGNATFSNSATITGNVVMSNTLAVTGSVDLSNTLTTAGLANVASLKVVGESDTGNVNITGYANLSGDLVVSGNAIIGSDSSDVVQFNALANSSLVPAANITYSLGSTGLRWDQVFAANVEATNLNVVDAVVSGNLTIQGTLTQIDTDNITIEDSIIKLARNNVADSLDIGFYGKYNDGTDRYTGLFRDQSDGGTYKLFKALEAEPTTLVDTSNTSYTIAELETYLDSGGLVTRSDYVAITANTVVNVNIVANTLTLSTALAGTSGGTGLNTYTAEDIIVANSSNGFRKLGLGTSGYVLQSNGSALVYDTLDGGTF